MRVLALALLLGAAAVRGEVLLSPSPPSFVPRARSRVRRLSPAPPLASVRVRAAEHPAAALDLTKSLDALRNAGPISIGGRPYKVGVAADRDFKYFFAVFTRGGASRLEAVSRPRDFSHGGVVLSIGGAPYRVRVMPKLTDPVRGSELRISPLDERDGDETVWTTGEVLELLERKATFVRADGEEFHVAYLSDLDPGSGRPTGTRSFLFFRESRFRARAWTLAEGDVGEGARVIVALGDRLLLLERRRDLLLIFPAAAGS